MDKTTKIIIGIVVAVVVIWGGYALIGKPAQTSAETIKIGISAPLTGEAASWGTAYMAGVQLAVKEINDAGGIDGRKIEVVVEDDQCSATAGASVANKLTSIDKVVAIAGPVCSSAAGPALPVIQNAKIPAVIMASAPSLTKVGDYIFRNYPSDAFQGKFAAEYMVNTMGKKNIAIVYVKNDWGMGLKDVFVNRVKEVGGTVVFEEGITQDAKDMRTVIAKIKAAKPDAIYLPIYPANAIAMFKQLKEAGVTVPLIGADSFATDEVAKSSDGEGVMYTVGGVNNPEDFQNKIKAMGQISTFVSTYGYDAIKIIAQAIEKAGSTDGEAVRDALAKTDYKEAIAVAEVTFDANRELETAEYDVMVIKNQTGVKVQ